MQADLGLCHAAMACQAGVSIAIASVTPGARDTQDRVSLTANDSLMHARVRPCVKSVAAACMDGVHRFLSTYLDRNSLWHRRQHPSSSVLDSFHFDRSLQMMAHAVAMRLGQEGWV